MSSVLPPMHTFARAEIPSQNSFAYSVFQGIVNITSAIANAILCSRKTRPNVDAPKKEIIEPQQLAKHLSAGDVVAFKTDFRSIKNQDKAEIISNLIKTVSSSEYDLLVIALLDLYPALQNCIVKCADKDGKIVGRTLRPEGIRVILEFFKTRGLITKDCVVCDDFTDFKMKLGSVKEGNLKCFIVRHYKKEDRSAHVSPVFFERTDKECHALITDSTGNTVTHVVKDPLSMGSKEEMTYIDELARCIQETAIGATVYYYPHRRQFDQTTCTVLSVLDTSGACKVPNMMKFVQANSVPSSNSKRLKELTILPVEMTELVDLAAKYREFEKYIILKTINKSQA